jgi:hypothetical protein
MQLNFSIARFLLSGILALLLSCGIVRGQVSADSIPVSETGQLLTWLAENERKGRANYTKEQVEVAAFIADYFRQCGLKPFSEAWGFFHAFAVTDRPLKAPLQIHDLLWNGKRLQSGQFFTNEPLPLDRDSVLQHYTLLRMDRPGAVDSLEESMDTERSLLLWWPTDESLSALDTDTLRALATLNPANVIMVADPRPPNSVRLLGNRDYVASVLHNVIAVLPGKSMRQEAVIFSAHYDHIGTDVRTGRQGLFNGANDNASGVTAVLQLAKYYAMRGPQERTLIFICFAGEELGLLGSKLLSQKTDPAGIAAMINVEMIAQHGAVGKRAFFFTGPGKSTLPEIMARNLLGTGVKIYPDRGRGNMLFERSDNFPFFERGIPAHSIMCSDDSDPCYHLPCDDVKGVDIVNMNLVIRAISTSVESIVQGRDRPQLKGRIRNKE